MHIRPDKSFLDYFYHWETETPQNVYLKQPFGDTFRDFTWKDAGNQIRRIAAYLKAQNLPAGSNIGLVSKNCAEWILTDLAIGMADHVSVPFYPTLTADQLNQVLVHSECQYLFVGKLDEWPGMKAGIPDYVTCISFPDYNADSDHLQWNDLLAAYQPLPGTIRRNMADLFTIIYTSGTTGNPKGVMMTFGAMAHGIFSTQHAARLDLRNTRFFSYLPLGHVAERNLVEAASLVTGGTVYFADTLATFSKNLQDASPTHFCAVPRIWMKFQQTILEKMPQKKLDLFLKIPILNNFIRKKIKTGLGLSNAEVILTGAAPIPEYLIKWYRKLGITVQDAYGMTENLGAVCMMPKNNFRDGTVGQLYPNMEVKIDSTTGEIMTRSAWNMSGYFKEPDSTAKTINEDNWILTGDVGELDADKFLKITGRVKEMYKTSKGEYVAPAQIEMGFADNNFIDQVCVVGQNLPQPVALVVLSATGKSHEKDEITKNLANCLAALNPILKNHERINKIVVLADEWTIGNNKLTPTMKIKRNIIESEFEERIKNWYEVKGKVIWE